MESLSIDPCVHGRWVLLPMMSTAMSGLLHLWFLWFLDLEGIISKILQTYCTLSFVILGLRIASDVLIGKAAWDALFQPPNFFSKYKYMISPVFVCLNVTLSISSCGLYHKLNVCLKVDAIKICFGSVVFYWWSVCVKNTFKYSRWKRKVEQFVRQEFWIKFLGVFLVTIILISFIIIFHKQRNNKYYCLCYQINSDLKRGKILKMIKTNDHFNNWTITVLIECIILYNIVCYFEQHFLSILQQ